MTYKMKETFMMLLDKGYIAGGFAFGLIALLPIMHCIKFGC